VSEQTNERQLSPDGKWWWDGVAWRPTTQGAGFAVAMRVFDYVVVGMFCWVVFPIALAVLMAFITPTYWYPMFSTALGIGLLAAGVGATAIGLALTWVARRLVRPSRGALLAAVGIMLVAFLTQFVTWWIVLLGPAIIILSRPPQT
jgi:hypothetical protein